MEAVLEWYSMIDVAYLTMMMRSDVNKKIARNSNAVELLLAVSKRHSRDAVVMEQAKGALLLLQKRYCAIATR